MNEPRKVNPGASRFSLQVIVAVKVYSFVVDAPFIKIVAKIPLSISGTPFLFDVPFKITKSLVIVTKTSVDEIPTNTDLAVLSLETPCNSN